MTSFFEIGFDFFRYLIESSKFRLSDIIMDTEDYNI